MTDIVVIEDELTVLDNILDTLEAAGYSAHGAESGSKGVELIRTINPDLIICDIFMPEMDGYQVLQKLKQDDQTSTIPFIFLTAKAERSDLRYGMDLGADDYITKPFTQRELLKAISTRLRKRTALQEKYESTISSLRKNIAYALPHELRTPLMHVLGGAELLNSTHTTLSQDEIQKIAASILIGGRRLHRLIENYLVYAQIEIISSDKQQIEGLRRNICAAHSVVVQKSRERANANERPDDLILEVEDSHLPISGENLAKIIEELVDNSFKFSNPGKKVRVRGTRREKGYLLEVCDQGVGMNAEQISAVGAYMQFERTLREQQGLGLGLAIAQRLVHLHGGQFKIYSKPNKGTCVFVQFSQLMP
jgi:signal transduction histidine kinase